MSNAATTVTQASPAHPPIMSVGKITMENLAKFKNCARRHFAYKAIPAEAWIAANDETLIALTFKNFLLCLQVKFLSSTWFLDYGKTLATPQQDSSFSDWSSAMCHANNAAHIDKMRAEITAHWDKKPNATGPAVILTTTVAAVLDPLDNDVDNGMVLHTSDEDIDMFPDKYVIPKPLHWIGSVNMPNAQFHAIQMLIDHGLPPALISDSLAT
ncbi:hypothetical protein C0991_000850 [Blastosporella zonata]|nr:hypothetical protein C0991_000850 [Blastosporella zonata]